MGKLNVCPFCGTPARTDRVKVIQLYGLYYVKCECCSAQSGSAKTEDEAIGKWNHREQLTVIKNKIIGLQDRIIQKLNKEVFDGIGELLEDRAWRDDKGGNFKK